MWECSWYFLHRENLRTCAHWGFHTTKTWARGLMVWAGLVCVRQCCQTPALSLPGPPASGPINAPSSLSVSYKLHLSPAGRSSKIRGSVVTPLLKQTLCLKHLLFHFQASRKTAAKSLKLMWEKKAAIGNNAASDFTWWWCSLHSAHAFTGYKIDSVSRQDSLVKNPKAISTLLCGWSLWAEPGGSQ